MLAKASRVPVAMSWPQTAIRPLVGRNRWVTSAISVVLPAPLGPSRAVNRPVATVKLTPSSAATARV
jgi:hypothetical protein